MQYVSRNWAHQEEKEMRHHYPNLEYDDIERLINQKVVGKRAERDRKVLRYHYIDGLTFEKCAEKSEVSVRTAYNIVYRWEKVLFK